MSNIQEKSRSSRKRTKNLRPLLRYLIYLVPVILILVGYGAITVYADEPYPFTIVLGPSMEPTILPGSVAMIEKVPFNQLRPGDVIVFVPQVALLYSCQSAPSNSLTRETSVPCFVIHRIVKITANGSAETLETKGDNNGYSIPLYDTGINSSMYIGKVVLQFPIAGYVTITPYNEVIAFVILLALAGQLLYERRSSTSSRRGGVVDKPSPPGRDQLTAKAEEEVDDEWDGY